MAREITLTFSDGQTHVYRGVPDDVTPDQVSAKAKADFPDRGVANINGGSNPATIGKPQAPAAPAQRSTEQLLQDLGPAPAPPPPPGLIDRVKSAAGSAAGAIADRFNAERQEIDAARAPAPPGPSPAADAVHAIADTVATAPTDLPAGTPPQRAGHWQPTARGPQWIADLSSPIPQPPSKLEHALDGTQDTTVAPSITPLEAAYGGTVAPGHEAAAIAAVQQRRGQGNPAPPVPRGTDVRQPNAVDDFQAGRAPAAPVSWLEPASLSETDKLVKAAGGEKSAWGQGVRAAADTTLAAARMAPELGKFGTEALELASAGYITSPTEFMERWDRNLSGMASGQFHAQQIQLDALLHDPNASAAQVSGFLVNNPGFATQVALPSAGSMLVGAGGAKLGMKLALTAAERAGLRGAELVAAGERGAEWGSAISNAAMNGADNFHETQGDPWQKFLSAAIAAGGTLAVGKLTEGGAAARAVTGGTKFSAHPVANVAANLGASVGKEATQEFGEQVSQDVGQGVAEGTPLDANAMAKNATMAAIQGGLLGVAGAGGNAKPRSIAHDAILASVDDVAAKHGLMPKAAAALRDAVVSMAPAEAISFVERALHGFEREGMVKRAGTPTVFRTTLADRLAAAEPSSDTAPAASGGRAAASGQPTEPALSPQPSDNTPASEVASPLGAIPASSGDRDRGASGPVDASALLGAPTEDDVGQANAIAAAAHAAAATSPLNAHPEPTDAQKEAGNYRMGHVNLHGLDITIENPQGSQRTGVSPDGTAWSNTMAAHYGYIKGTTASDGDHVDTFIGPSPTSQTAYVVDQVDPNTGKFDEPKTILGATSEQQARELYLANYAKDWNGLGAITALPMASFKAWVKDGVKSKPLGDLAQWKPAAAPSAPSAPTPADGAPSAPSAPVAKIAGQAVDQISDGQLARFAKSTSIAPAARDAAAAEVARRAAPPAAGGSFTTAKGSTYQVNEDGTTTRDKAYRPDHGEAEQGQQTPSQQTFYVDHVGLQKLAEFQAISPTSTGRRIAVHPNGMAGIQYTKGKDEGKFERRTMTDFSTKPAVGMTPVELWDDGKTVHFGNPIIEIRGQAAAPAQAAPAPSAAPTSEGVQHGQEEGRRQEVLTEGGRRLSEAGAPPAVDARGGAAARGQTNAQHPEHVMGSRVLGLISRHLGGLDPAMLADFSTRIQTKRIGKNGKPIVQWRNPPIAGVGQLFRKGGTSDFEEIGRVLEEHGYIPPGAGDAGQRAQDMVQRILAGTPEPQGWEDDLAAHRATQDAEADDHYRELDHLSRQEIEHEREAIMAEAGLQPGELDALPDDLIPWDAMGTTDPAALAAFLGADDGQHPSEADTGAKHDGQEAAAPAAPAAGPPAANREDAAQRPALTLEQQSAADLEAKAAREAASKAADAGEQKRLADKAKADAERGEFTLTGSDRPADVAAAAGQGDLLAEPPAAAPPPSPDRAARAKVAAADPERYIRERIPFVLDQLGSGGVLSVERLASNLGDPNREGHTLPEDVVRKVVDAMVKDGTLTRPTAHGVMMAPGKPTKENEHAPGTSDAVERDRANAGDLAPAVEADVSPVTDGTAWVDGRPGEPADEVGGGQQGDGGLRDGGAVAGREPGNQPVHRGDGAGNPSEFPARDRDGRRSDDPGIEGAAPEAVAADRTRESADDVPADVKKRAAQRAAESIDVKTGDIANIRATLPYLLPEQQDDVLKAETRFAVPEGYGMLFTNGTGTGKTFTGLGVVKRFARRGKTNILVVVPDMKIMADWVDSAKALGLTIEPLKDTKDAGKGLSITTYANLGDNDALASRAWDHVVPDESHMLMQEKDGSDTKALDNLRAITLHPRGVHQRFTMQNRSDIEAARAIGEQITANDKIRNADDTMDAMRDSLAAENAKLEAKLAPINARLDAARAANKAHVAANQGAARPRVTFLSATPFAYVPTVEWAEGFLFDYPVVEGRGYNEPDGQQQFMIEHFGYRMRTGKLTKPDAKVNTGLMERQFNAWLKKAGALSGRVLDVNADYDRKFILVDSAIGNQIDSALKFLGEKSRETSTAQKGSDTPINGWAMLNGEAADGFYGPLGHLVRRYLLEAIKSKEVIRHVRDHLALGRKVVVFHDFKKGGSTNPFAFEPRAVPTLAQAKASIDGERSDEVAQHIIEQIKARNVAALEFAREFPELRAGGTLEGLMSPIVRFKKEFPNVLLINGDEKPKDLLARYKLFNDDAAGPLVALVQSDKNKGWSGHDTTGKHQRVLFNLGLPTQPTKTIQQEGRIYRTGQVSNAIFRYLNTGTTWERWAFASTIAERASTAENLGMGESARALKDAYINAFEDSDSFPAGYEGEGTGGKERDRQANDALTEWDRAKTFYFGTQKKTARTKAQEGTDYFATPEPLGLKMVQWADMRVGEDVLEPSAGHGAIARWFPDNAQRTAIEPSSVLASRMALVFNGDGAKIVTGSFENLHVVNKYDAIVMNPPFGTAGRTAIDHLDLAASHLRDGGRIVALIPTGPAADKKFDTWFYGEESRPVKPIAKVNGADVYVGDTVKSRASFAPEGKVTDYRDGMLFVKGDGKTFASGVTPASVTEITATGPRTEKYRPAEGLHLVGQVVLPSSTFERAGTQVATRVVIIDKGERAPQPRQAIDLRGAGDIAELFNRLEDLAPAAARLKTGGTAPPTGRETPGPGRTAAQLAPRAPSKEAVREQIAATRTDIVEHTTGKGKVIKGVIRTDLTQAQAKAIDAYTWKKDGGYFIRAEHIAALEAAHPKPGGTMPLTSQAPFWSPLERAVQGASMKSAPAGGWQQFLKGLVSKGVKPDEIAWSGVEDWLKLQEGKVSRDAVLAYLREGGVRVSETMKSDARSLALPEGWVVVPDLAEGGFAVQDQDGEHMGFGATEDEAIIDSQDPEAFKDATPNRTKFSQYTLPGGKDYRELLLTLPQRAEEFGDWLARTGRSDSAESRRDFTLDTHGKDFKSGHWDEPNILAHVRFNERTDADGKRVLFIEEIQSDWAQAGKKNGFNAEAGAAPNTQEQEQAARAAAKDVLKSNDWLGFDGANPALQAVLANDDWSSRWDVPENERAPVDAWRDMVLAYRRWDARAKSQGVPRGPFVGKTEAWVGLAIKRMVKYAVDGGFDRVAFVNGEQSAARYDLSKQIDSIEVSRLSETDGSPAGKAITLNLPNFGGAIQFSVDTKANVSNVRSAHGLDIKNGTPLEDIIGKELAERVMAEQGLGVRTLEGEGLKVGGEGMKAFYDKIVPTVAKDVVRKLGGDGLTDIQIGEAGAMKVEQASDGRWSIVDADSSPQLFGFKTKAEADAALAKEFSAQLQQLGFDITDAMRAAAGNGLPLFRDGEATAPARRGVDPAALRDDVARLVAQWDNAPEITVVNTAFDLPAEIRRQLVDMRAANKTRALIMPDTGDVYVIAQANATLDDARFALMHEVLGHYGMRGFLGDEDAYYRTMYQLRQANPELAGEADEWLRQHGQGAVEGRIKRGLSPADAMKEVRALATEEALADRAARNEPIRGWQKIVAKVQAFLRSIGWDGLADRLERMSQAETAQLLSIARWHVTGSAEPHVFTVDGDRPLALTSQAAAAPAAAAPPPATLKPSSAPLDTALRFAMTPVAAVTSRAGQWAARTIDSTLERVPGRVWSTIKAGTVSDFGLADDYKDARALMETAIRKGTREAATVVDQLHGLSADEARVAYLWMQEKPDTEAEQRLLNTLPGESREILANLKSRIDELGKMAAELGLISHEVYERNEMSYLHRSYQKYALGGSKGEQARASVSKSRAVKILGDQYKGRGLRDDVADTKVADPDWWQRRRAAGQADTSLKGAKFWRLELRKTPDEETEDFVGAVERRLGRLQRVIYWPEGSPIPPHLADWRNDGLWEARFFDKRDKVGMWRDFTLDERTAMGEIQEVRYAAANTILAANRDVEVARMLKWVSENISELHEGALPAGSTLVTAEEGHGFGLVKPYRPDHWVQVPDVGIPGTGLKRWGALAGRYIPGPVWNDLRQVSTLAGGSEWGRLYTKAMNAWKVSKTALSPATHMNNVMSNFVLADAHDIQARHIVGAVRAWLGVRKGRAVKDPAALALIHTYQDNGGDGGKFTEGELREEVTSKLIAQLEEDIGTADPTTALVQASQMIDLLKHGEVRQALAVLGQTKTIGVAKKAVDVMIKAYGHEDEIFRLAAFIKAKADGLSDHDAGKFARESFIDYRINAPWIQAMRRTAWPFISFTYRVVPMMASVAINKPHKLAKWMLVAGGLNKLAYVMIAAGAGGGGLPPDELERRERAFLPDDKIGNELGVFPKLLRMPWNQTLHDRDGKVVGEAPEFLDLRRWIPGGDVSDTTGDQTAVPILSNLMPGGPLALMGEVVFNRDGFTGKNISEKTDYLSEKYSKLGGFLWRGVMPNFPGLPGSYSTDKLMNAGTGKLDALGREYSMADAMLQTIGVKVASYPRDSLQMSAMLEARANLRQIMAEVKAQQRMLTRNGISQAAFDKAVAEAQDKIKTINEKLAKKMAQADGQPPPEPVTP